MLLTQFSHLPGFPVACLITQEAEITSAHLLAVYLPSVRFVLQDHNLPPCSLAGPLSTARYLHSVPGYLVITRLSHISLSVPIAQQKLPFFPVFFLFPLKTLPIKENS